MTALIGFRIEFCDYPDENSPWRLVGGVVLEDAFLVQAVPHQDDRIAVDRIAGGTQAGAWWPGSLPFVPVHHVEHYPAATDGGQSAGVQVVIKTDAPSEWQAKQLVDHFGQAGWQFHVSVEDSAFGREVRKRL